MSRCLAPRCALAALLFVASSWRFCVVEGVASPFLDQQHHILSGSPSSSREPGRLLGLAGRLRAGASTAMAAAVAGAADRPTFSLPGGGGDPAGGNNARGALGAPQKKKGDLGVRTRSTLVLVESFLTTPP